MDLTAAELREIIREEIQNALGLEKVAYTYPQAAAAVGLSVEALRLAVGRNELVPHYYGIKPLFAPAELHRWIASLPEEPVRR